MLIRLRWGGVRVAGEAPAFPGTFSKGATCLQDRTSAALPPSFLVVRAHPLHGRLPLPAGDDRSPIRAETDQHNSRMLVAYRTVSRKSAFTLGSSYTRRRNWTMVVVPYLFG